MHLNLNITTKINIHNDLKAPIEEGSVIGDIEIYSDNKLIDKRNVIVRDKIEKNSYRDSLRKEAREFRTL